MLYSSTVVYDLLQSCYTGILQFSSEEIVNYLTAASYLQMEHIVERCRGALKKYMQLKNPSPPKVTKLNLFIYFLRLMLFSNESEKCMSVGTFFFLKLAII